MKSGASAFGSTVLAVVLLINAAILLVCHDRDWWPPDDGSYAHIAERLLAGEVLNREVQDIHPGYVHLANATAMAVFGLRLDSPRKLIALLVLVQSVLAFLILRRCSALTAGVGSLAAAAIGAPQFFNPTAHWYCLFLFFCLVWLVVQGDLEKAGRLEALGFLTGSVLLFRQLTGVLLAIGVVAFVLGKLGRERVASPWLARAVLVVSAAGLGSYLLATGDAAGFWLFGVWPLAILLATVRAARTDTRATLVILGRLAAGAAVGILPMLLYHLLHGSFSWWLSDMFSAALTMLAFGDANYSSLVESAVGWLLLEPFGRSGLGSFFWIFLMALPAVNGLLVLHRQFTRDRWPSSEAWTLPFLAAFYGLVSLHYAIPVYILYSSSATLCGLLVSCSLQSPRLRRAAIAVALFLSITAVWLYAGQSTTKTLEAILSGERVSLIRSDAIERSGLRIPRPDLEFYSSVIGFIRDNALPDESILALPSDAELYFLAERPNPTRFFNTAFGVPDQTHVDRLLERLRKEPPRVVIFNPEDKYNDAESLALVEGLVADYREQEPIGPFRVFLRPRTKAAEP